MRVGDPWIASTIVFIASFCTLVIELIAGRIMAPYIGVSLYTWTSIIGVCLAGIALGNYAGGRLADRAASGLTLGVLFLLSGVAALAILALVEWVITAHLGRGWPLMARIVVETTVVFFAPTFLLGTITPVVIKLSLGDLRVTGSTVGRIYAVSTVGAIAGTFATGFYLIEAMGTRSIVLAVAIVLIVVGLLLGRSWRTPARALWLAFVIVVLALFYGSRESFAAPCVRESSYYCIAVNEATIEGRSVRSLALDHLVHSYVDPDDPRFIGYSYERVYAELTEFHVRDTAEFRTLSIGGGGYTFPRYLTAVHPGARADVLEIDPAVTQAARDHLGLAHDPRMTTYHQDARLWFIEHRPVERYDIVYGDAYNDLSVPYHLTTLEFYRMVRSAMKPDAILMANVIDNYISGEFLRASVRTLSEVFEQVYLLALGRAWEGRGAGTYVVAASASPIDIHAFMEYEGPRTRRDKFSAVMDAATLREYLASGRRIVLTDDYAPVDNLVAPLFIERALRSSR